MSLLDLIDKLPASYWDWQLPLFLGYGFPMDFRGSHLDLRNDGIDFSWPQEAIVNYFTKCNEYLGTVLKLNYPSVHTFVECLISIGKGCEMLKIELPRAFRQLKVDPADYPLLCLQWQDSYYLDTAFAFGHISTLRVDFTSCLFLLIYVQELNMFRH